MERILAIFLVLWLPLFMQSAWAMSTRMMLQETQTYLAVQASLDAASEATPCHASTAEADTHQGVHDSHGTHCLACAIAMAHASYAAAPQFHLPDLTQVNTCSASKLYLSIHLPAAIKPPISTRQL